MGFHTIENYVSRFQLNKRIILITTPTVLIHFSHKWKLLKSLF